MTNPWNITSAFSPMFTDTVEINGVRPNGCVFRDSFASCVYPPEDDVAFGDCEADTTRKRIKLLVIKRGDNGWNKRFPPQMGDEVALEDGSKWKMTSVDNQLNWFSIEARSC